MDFFFFVVYPYIALTVLIVGSIARYERDPFTWKSRSSQFLRRKQLIWGSILFHVGVLIIFVGHLIGLLTPIAVFDAFGVGHGFKQVGAIVVGGIAGVMAIVGGGMLLHRRLFDPRIRMTSTFADTGILVLLMVQLVLGLGTILVSIQHLDGEEMVRFMTWAQGVFTFRVDGYMNIVEANWLFKAHLILGLTIMIIFPFTRLVHMFSVPVRYLWRPGYQVVRSRRRATPQGILETAPKDLAAAAAVHPVPDARAHPAE